MNCKSVQKQMVLYSPDELNNIENSEFKDHLEVCPKCKNLFYELNAVLRIEEKKESIEPNPFLYTRIKQRIVDLEADNLNYAGNPFFKKVLQPVLLSLILIVGLFIGIKLGSSYKDNQPEQSFNSQTTEYYLNDIEQEKMEVILLEE